jgi:hypothetical protein
MVGGVILPQGMPHELVVTKDAAKTGMIGKPDPEHVKGLTLKPVGSAPDRRDRGNLSALFHLNLQTQPLVLRIVKKVVDDIEASLATGPIDTTKIDKKAKAVLLAERKRDISNFVCGHRENMFPDGSHLVLKVPLGIETPQLADHLGKRRAGLGSHSTNLQKRAKATMT